MSSKGPDLKQFKSFKNLRRQVMATRDLILAFDTQRVATQALIESLKVRERPGYTKHKKFLEVSEVQRKKLYELGFLSFFANFECFMFEIVKELFEQNPEALKSEKGVTYGDLKDLTSAKQIRQYIIDAVAIEKSQDVTAWSEFLSKSFGIKIFTDGKQRERYILLNALRNLAMHSGGKTSSRFSRIVGDILKTRVPIGMNHTLDMEENFNRMYGLINGIITRYE